MLTSSQINNISIAGRLGNQMWEIASTIGLASTHGHKWTFPQWKYSKYFKYPNMINDIGIPEDTLWSVVLHEGTDYREFNLLPYLNYDIRGYFQSWKYFEHCKDYIKQMFEFNFDTVNTEDKVAVHVRRGDYLNLTWIMYPLTIENYYSKAMDYFHRNTTYTIFSDDIEWCKRNFNTDYCEFVEPTSDIVDLAYMNMFKHHIIANSSYSFWAGYLGEDNGVVIAPQHWYSNGYDEKDICPPDWIRI